MAKRKATNPSKAPPATPKRKSTAPTNSTSAASPTKPVSQRPISSEEIGQVAGEIWSLLSNGGEQTLTAIKKSVGASPDIVLAAIGWLAREDKLEFSTSGRATKISLR